LKKVILFTIKCFPVAVPGKEMFLEAFERERWGGFADIYGSFFHAWRLAWEKGQKCSSVNITNGWWWQVSRADQWRELACW